MQTITIDGKEYKITPVEGVKEENKLPKTWEELGRISGYYVDGNSELYCYNNDYSVEDYSKNVRRTKEQAEASIAMAQLSQLMYVWNDWRFPDWNNNEETKYCIVVRYGEAEGCNNTYGRCFLAFKTEKIRDEFLENFRDLIAIAKPLL